MMASEIFDGSLARKMDGLDDNLNNNLNNNFNQAGGSDGCPAERVKESINGKIVMMAPAKFSHVTVGGNLYRIFFQYLKGKNCVPIPDGLLVKLTEKDHFVPDFMVVCDRDKIKSDGIRGAPDLVAEILSRSTEYYDRGYKMRIYARCGVREYWIIDTRLKSVEQYILKNGGFELLNLYGMPDQEELDCMEPEEREAIRMRFTCAIFPELEIELKDIFYNPLDEAAERESEG